MCIYIYVCYFYFFLNRISLNWNADFSERHSHIIREIVSLNIFLSFLNFNSLLESILFSFISTTIHCVTLRYWLLDDVQMSCCLIFILCSFLFLFFISLFTKISICHGRGMAPTVANTWQQHHQHRRPAYRGIEYDNSGCAVEGNG